MLKNYFTFLLFFLVVSFSAIAQSVGDYRTTGSGNWSDTSIWEYFDGTNWIDDTDPGFPGYPGELPGTNDVTILPGDEVTMDVDVSEPFNSLVIASDDATMTGGNLIMPKTVDYDLFVLELIMEPGYGIMTWEGNANLYLLENSSISAYPGAFVTENAGNGNDNCSSSQSIWLGTVKFSTCSGSSGENNFDDIENAPGKPTAEEFQSDCGPSVTAVATPPAGASIIWYDAQTNGNVVADPTLTSPGTVVYWAASVDDADPTNISVFRQRVELTYLPNASFTTQPTDASGFVGDDVTFTVTAADATSYQWQVSVDGGVTWTDIDPAGNPTAATDSLVITDIKVADHDSQYRVVVTNDGTSCPGIISNEVTLDVSVMTVITNRTKTYRVNKN